MWSLGAVGQGLFAWPILVPLLEVGCRWECILPGATRGITQAAGRSSCSAVSTRPVVPGDRGVHGWDSFLLPVRAGTNPCCNCGTSRLQTLFLSRFELGSKASPCRSVPFLGSRAVVPLSESFQISFAIPNPPARGLHSWRFMPPVCTGAVLVAGSHTLAGE